MAHGSPRARHMHRPVPLGSVWCAAHTCRRPAQLHGPHFTHFDADGRRRTPALTASRSDSPEYGSEVRVSLAVSVGRRGRIAREFVFTPGGPARRPPSPLLPLPWHCEKRPPQLAPLVVREGYLSPFRRMRPWFPPSWLHLGAHATCSMVQFTDGKVARSMDQRPRLVARRERVDRSGKPRAERRSASANPLPSNVVVQPFVSELRRRHLHQGPRSWFDSGVKGDRHIARQSLRQVPARNPPKKCR
jgi:hypothetical protein